MIKSKSLLHNIFVRSFLSGRSKIQNEKYIKWYEVNWAGSRWKKRKIWAKLQMVMDTNWVVILNNQSFAISKHDTFFLNLGFWFNWFVDMVFPDVYCLFMFADKTVSNRAFNITKLTVLPLPLRKDNLSLSVNNSYFQQLLKIKSTVLLNFAITKMRNPLDIKTAL